MGSQISTRILGRRTRLFHLSLFVTASRMVLPKILVLAGGRRTGALGLEELGVGAGGVLGTEDALRRAKNARKEMRQTVSFFSEKSGES